MPPAAAVYARTLTDVPTRTPGSGRHEPNKNERSLTEGACPRSYLASVPWVLTWGTLGTHMGYAGYSHGELWVLTWGTLGTHMGYSWCSFVPGLGTRVSHT
jgi:hypothetical protein